METGKIESDRTQPPPQSTLQGALQLIPGFGVSPQTLGSDALPGEAKPQ